ncbi:SprT family protein [Streptococcus equi subsp. zooepidemicus]|uniref:SprT family protein n=1 Tax=Streptococcus equi TaxID=1336 RepID=UPI0005B8BCBB|nr:SprT family protein [Streptococcus equi]MDI5945600.1 SprT family protein [Streptococcus equi subsp. zooepidemicus]HEK9998030.1 SprT family protein [Streptococcus equi subsp. zooepidemicus]HEL0002240.1 SprT family protein [Streptococcus equi subsp. zooepidemicus]HEL0665149.1 SprT family protein [Streptococcus equi subsp. zooepidemicus]HEL0687552.1 SprT family protein [Streptococcus equi subsp. zooepidemicus]
MTLTDYVREVSLADFGKPFRHQASWNRRLRTTGGRFFPKDGHLDFNPKILEEHGETVFRQIVRHELCHYHLYFEGLGFRHKDQAFKELLDQVDGLRYAPKLQSHQANYLYICQHCGQAYDRKRPINLAVFACGRCHGRLIKKNQS